MVEHKLRHMLRDILEGVGRKLGDEEDLPRLEYEGYVMLNF